MLPPGPKAAARQELPSVERAARPRVGEQLLLQEGPREIWRASILGPGEESNPCA